jgi:hypothetical protein
MDLLSVTGLIEYSECSSFRPNRNSEWINYLKERPKLRIERIISPILTCSSGSAVPVSDPLARNRQSKRFRVRSHTLRSVFSSARSYPAIKRALPFNSSVSLRNWTVYFEERQAVLCGPSKDPLDCKVLEISIVRTLVSSSRETRSFGRACCRSSREWRTTSRIIEWDRGRSGSVPISPNLGEKSPLPDKSTPAKGHPEITPPGNPNGGEDSSNFHSILKETDKKPNCRGF